MGTRATPSASKPILAWISAPGSEA